MAAVHGDDEIGVEVGVVQVPGGVVGGVAAFPEDCACPLVDGFSGVVRDEARAADGHGHREPGGFQLVGEDQLSHR